MLLNEESSSQLYSHETYLIRLAFLPFFLPPWKYDKSSFSINLIFIIQFNQHEKKNWEKCLEGEELQKGLHLVQNFFGHIPM